MCREYKWEHDRLDNMEYDYEFLVEKRDILYIDILYEFQFVNNYYKLYTLSMNEFKYSYKNDLINYKYIDLKLINILLLPNDIIKKIFRFLFISLTKEVKLSLDEYF